jgi:cell wall-associated NlpC family hydrolase
MTFLKRNKLRSVVCVAVGLTLVIIASPSSFAHSRPSRLSILRTRQLMASRGAATTAVDSETQQMGRLAVVTVDDAPINAPREDYGRLLSRCPKGTNIVVTGEATNYYSVIMSNYTIGFILKKNVELLPLEVSSPLAGGPLAASIRATALRYLYVPYVWGGNTTDGIDCSGLVKAVFSANGIELPRTAAEQANQGYQVPLTDVAQWLPGDRMYFQCHHSYIDHAGMYIGNGWFIHSSIGNNGVNVTRVDSPYYWSHLVAVRRSPQLVSDAQTAQATPATADYESDQQ